MSYFRDLMTGLSETKAVEALRVKQSLLVDKAVSHISRDYIFDGRKTVDIIAENQFLRDALRFSGVTYDSPSLSICALSVVKSFLRIALRCVSFFPMQIYCLYAEARKDSIYKRKETVTGPRPEDDKYQVCVVQEYLDEFTQKFPAEIVYSEHDCFASRIYFPDASSYSGRYYENVVVVPSYMRHTSDLCFLTHVAHACNTLPAGPTLLNLRCILEITASIATYVAIFSLNISPFLLVSLLARYVCDAYCEMQFSTSGIASLIALDYLRDESQIAASVLIMQIQISCILGLKSLLVNLDIENILLMFHFSFWKPSTTFSKIFRVSVKLIFKPVAILLSIIDLLYTQTLKAIGSFFFSTRLGNQ
ncbi:MAG: hypothetical protein LBC42_00735 [Puniceicoccales bacterium]|jgi:hypothetical protein|nr:hypothetical protein [Puniceicoccales bacterium]